MSPWSRVIRAVHRPVTLKDPEQHEHCAAAAHHHTGLPTDPAEGGHRALNGRGGQDEGEAQPNAVRKRQCSSFPWVGRVRREVDPGAASQPPLRS